MSTPLNTLLNTVLTEDVGRAQFAQDPAAFMADHGWTDLDSAELSEAVMAFGDSLPVPATIALDETLQTVEFAGDDLDAVASGLAEVSAGFDPAVLTAEDHALDELDFGLGADAAEAIELEAGIDDAMDFDSGAAAPSDDSADASASSDEVPDVDDFESIDDAPLDDLDQVDLAPELDEGTMEPEVHDLAGDELPIELSEPTPDLDLDL